MAKTSEHVRSSKPPWPGKIQPESLTPAARLNAEQARSPSCARSEIIAEKNITVPACRVGANIGDKVSPAATVAIIPPIAPSTVLFGLTCSASFLRPKRRPTKYAPVSLDREQDDRD